MRAASKGAAKIALMGKIVMCRFAVRVKKSIVSSGDGACSDCRGIVAGFIPNSQAE